MQAIGNGPQQMNYFYGIMQKDYYLKNNQQHVFSFFLDRVNDLSPWLGRSEVDVIFVVFLDRITVSVRY